MIKPVVLTDAPKNATADWTIYGTGDVFFYLMLSVALRTEKLSSPENTR